MRLAILDHDGVIADSFSAFREWYEHACNEFGKHYPYESDEELRKNTGGNYVENYERLGFDWEREGEDVWELWEAFDIQRRISPFPDTEKLLETLRENAVAVAVASANPEHQLNAFYKEHGLTHYFTAVAGIPEREETLVKPDPYVLVTALQRADAHPREAVYVGDTVEDARTAKNTERTVGAPVRSVLVAGGMGAASDLRNVAGARFVADRKNLASAVLDELG